MEVVAGKLLHATTSPELEEKAPSSIIFFPKLPWCFKLDLHPHEPPQPELL
jgi:hypothetical protein